MFSAGPPLLGALTLCVQLVAAGPARADITEAEPDELQMVIAETADSIAARRKQLRETLAVVTTARALEVLFPIKDAPMVLAKGKTPTSTDVTLVLGPYGHLRTRIEGGASKLIHLNAQGLAELERVMPGLGAHSIADTVASALRQRGQESASILSENRKAPSPVALRELIEQSAKVLIQELRDLSRALDLLWKPATVDALVAPGSDRTVKLNEQVSGEGRTFLRVHPNLIYLVGQNSPEVSGTRSIGLNKQDLRRLQKLGISAATINSEIKRVLEERAAERKAQAELVRDAPTQAQLDELVNSSVKALRTELKELRNTLRYLASAKPRAALFAAGEPGKTMAELIRTEADKPALAVHRDGQICTKANASARWTAARLDDAGLKQLQRTFPGLRHETLLASAQRLLDTQAKGGKSDKQTSVRPEASDAKTPAPKERGVERVARKETRPVPLKKGQAGKLLRQITKNR